MNARSRNALAALAAAALAALAGCASTPGSGPAAEAPTYRVGDRWVYHVEDGYRVKTVWDETREVTAIGPDGITILVTKKGPSTNATFTELWASPGRMSAGPLCNDDMRRFPTPLVRFDFPLAEGRSWRAWYDNVNETAIATGTLVARQVNYFARVQGWERVQGYDAIRVFQIMRLDDDTFWHWPTECRFTTWYAPAIRGTVREERLAQYLEKGGPGPAGGGLIRTLVAVAELVSFTPGP